MRPGVRSLINTRLRPNHLTTARLCSGLAAALCFAAGDPSWNWAGAGLFLLAMTLDRADGELARLQASGSRFGHLYDLVADGASNAAVFVGIGIGVARAGGAFAEAALVLGIVAGLAVALAEVVVLRMDVVGTLSTAEVGGFYGFDADDAMIVVPIAVLAGAGGWLLVAAAVGGSAAFAYLSYKALRGSSGSGQ